MNHVIPNKKHFQASLKERTTPNVDFGDDKTYKHTYYRSFVF